MKTEISISYDFKSSRAKRGAIAEQKLVAYLRRNGYTVIAHNGKKYNKSLLLGSDIVAINPQGEIIRIECKFSSIGNDKKFRATTIKKDCTDHRKSDVIVFLCQLPYNGGICVPFIIPAHVQGNKPHIVITSNPLTYNGQYSKFRNAWDNLKSN